ncbi:hypothetical protein GQ53DRAFT_865710 [Thozetella sp. PMI_491]|nr:hypothetical protein GQ53DRAFT_865710 [Thozetella sp. PMI_491]
MPPQPTADAATLATLTSPNHKHTEWTTDEVLGVPPIQEEDRAACEEWLSSGGFLAPGQDEETWEAIQAGWEGRSLAAMGLVLDSQGEEDNDDLWANMLLDVVEAQSGWNGDLEAMPYALSNLLQRMVQYKGATA